MVTLVGLPIGMQRQIEQVPQVLSNTLKVILIFSHKDTSHVMADVLMV